VIHESGRKRNTNRFSKLHNLPFGQQLKRGLDICKKHLFSVQQTTEPTKRYVHLRQKDGGLRAGGVACTTMREEKRDNKSERSNKTGDQ
jgi:hypothetical protein